MESIIGIQSFFLKPYAILAFLESLPFPSSLLFVIVLNGIWIFKVAVYDILKESNSGTKQDNCPMPPFVLDE